MNDLDANTTKSILIKSFSYLNSLQGSPTFAIQNREATYINMKNI